MSLIEACSVIPERACLRYHLVSVTWFKKWQVYTSSHDEDADHPGSINDDFATLCVAKELLLNSDQFFGSNFLKDGMREDIHYKVLDDQTWRFLHERYGGIDVPRLSIELPKDNNGGKNDFLVEINLRRFTTITFPRVKYIQGTNQPLHTFISRQATVLELHA